MNHKKYLKLAILSFVIFSFTTFISSCTDSKKQEEGLEDEEEFDPGKDILTNLYGELFSIPSPLQTSILLKSSGANYSKDLLNVTSKLPSYSTEYKKALNLGVYGADLGYVIIYGQTQDALGYLSASKKLAEDINVSGAFDENLMKRFEKNMNNNDSLLNIFTSAYRATDTYLKNNERNAVSAMVITGGWVESLYFTLNILKKDFKNKQVVIQRVGEQKNTLDHVIKLLTPYYQNPDLTELTELTDALLDLFHDFEDIEMKYTYVKPTTDVANKITTINSTTEVKITDEQLNNISEKLAGIRSMIIN
jgi:DNA-directed RNA polymerase subunit F